MIVVGPVIATVPVTVVPRVIARTKVDCRSVISVVRRGVVIARIAVVRASVIAVATHPYSHIDMNPGLSLRRAAQDRQQGN